MTTIDLDVDYEDVKDTDSFPTVPTATYPFVVGSAQAAISQRGKHKGKQQLQVQLQVEHPETNEKVNVLHSMYLPSKAEPRLGGGSWGFVAFTKAIGRPWTAGPIDTSDYIGESGTVEIVEERQSQNEEGEYVDDPNAKPRNRVKAFHSQIDG